MLQAYETAANSRRTFEMGTKTLYTYFISVFNVIKLFWSKSRFSPLLKRQEQGISEVINILDYNFAGNIPSICIFVEVTSIRTNFFNFLNQDFLQKSFITFGISWRTDSNPRPRDLRSCKTAQRRRRFLKSGFSSQNLATLVESRNKSSHFFRFVWTET